MITSTSDFIKKNVSMCYRCTVYAFMYTIATGGKETPTKAQKTHSINKNVSNGISGQSPDSVPRGISPIPSVSPDERRNHSVQMEGELVLGQVSGENLPKLY